MKSTLQIIGLLCILFVVSACQDDTEQEADNNAAYEYEEQEIIVEEIDEGDYDVDVETDNQGTRVMIYEIDGEKYYKTILVKDDNRLKIIDLQNDDVLIYNETI